VNSGIPEGTLRQLPIQIRPDRGETVDSYVRRLARANHLRPTHLRRFLSYPASHYAAVKPDRLAIMSGRSQTALEHALLGLTKAARGRREPIKPLTTRHVHRQADKPELFAAIRYAARREGMSIRAMEARFHVHRRTIRQALASPIPPPRKKIDRQPYALVGLDRLIDAMLDARPDMRAGHIWERLIDDHDANVSYASVRAYVAKRRAAAQTGQGSLTQHHADGRGNRHDRPPAVPLKTVRAGQPLRT